MASGEKSYLGHRKRLRERFKRTALEGFHDYEVVELLLTYAIPRRDVKPAAKALVKRFGGLKGVLEAKADELGTVDGIGKNASVLLTLLKEVGGVYLRERQGWKDPVSSPGDVVDFLNRNSPGLEAEKFLALYLNSKNHVIEVEVLHEGEVAGMPLLAREMISKAIKHNARSVIFVHNLGRGSGLEGGFDGALIKELSEAASALDIIVHDHIVVFSGNHVSARSRGWLGR